MPQKTPSYRYHKARNCAVVTIDGKNHYLGTFNSEESLEQYHKLIAEYFERKSRGAPLPIAGSISLTINELILAYWKHVESYYVKDGKPTSEPATVRHALRFVRKLYGSSLAGDFSPKSLKAVRQVMIEHPIVRKMKVKDEVTGETKKVEKVLAYGLTRKFINKQMGRIKRMFAWAVEEELVPVAVHDALLRVSSLKKGKSAARDKPRIRSVSDAAVEATLPFVRPVVGVMIQVQKLCGCRPQDIVLIRRIDIDMNGLVWEYRPSRYKTEHCNDDDDPDLERVIYLGPQAQGLLRPYIDRKPEEFVFNPRESESERNAEKKKKRKTPRWPSHERHQEKSALARPRSKVRDHYDVAAYRRAIRRACEKASIPNWHPNQLRHSRLTEIRKRFGLEASKACAGHREIGVTQHYAEQDQLVARKVMAEIG